MNQTFLRTQQKEEKVAETEWGVESLQLLETVEEQEEREEERGKVLSIGEALNRIIDKTGKSRALPNNWQCGINEATLQLDYKKGCGFFLLNPQRVADMKSWGYNQMQINGAWCLCDEKNIVIARSRREATQESNLPKYAQNQKEPTLFNFNPSSENLKEAMRKATNFCGLEGARLLTFTGGVGVGKTHLLESIGRAFLQSDRTVRYENYSDFMEYVNSNKERSAELFFYEKTYEDFIRDVDLLVLDEVMPTTDYQRKELFNVIESRLRQPYLYTVMATNLPVEDMKADFGKRLHSRVLQSQGNAEVWEIKAEDYRLKNRI